MASCPLTRGARLFLAVSCACAALSPSPAALSPDAPPPSGPAYLLIALPSHDVIAQSRPDVLATPIAPGSVMKVITLAAALEQGALDANTRTLCRRSITVDGRALTCVHPDFHRAIGPVEALAHSCNTYFATVARRLPRSALDDMLVRVGLGPTTPGVPLVTAALGLGGVRATPRALLDAFCRLADAGTTDVHLKDETRRMLRLGLESAARTGTASVLAEAGYSGLAKTGTAPMTGGGYQGLVAAVVNSELPTHAIIVVAPGSTGAHAAALATEILIKHRVPHRVPAVVTSAGASADGDVAAVWRPGPSDEGDRVAVWSSGASAAGIVAAERRPGPSDEGDHVAVWSSGASAAGIVPAERRPRSADGATRTAPTAQSTGPRTAIIRVGIARGGGGYDLEDLPIEDYVARAVAGEGGDLLPTVALEALAVTVRTYAWANSDRHHADGFGVCDLTHCLSLRTSTAVSRAAARSTAGLMLTDRDGFPADVYLSAWCGGHTERPSQAWAGAVDHAYLPAQLDPACAHEPGWTSEMSEPKLRRVLEAAGLHGAIVGDLRAGARSASGRVRMLLVDGMWPDHVDGGAFRFAAGRVLGWQTIKSTLFDVARTGTGFRFTGKGSGHGVGLCVRGAAARARMGATRDQILAAYFPGLLAGTRRPDPRSPGSENQAPLRAVSWRAAPWSPGSSPRRRSGQADLASPQSMHDPTPPTVRVVLPEADLSQLTSVRTMAEAALAALAAKLGVDPPALVEFQFHPTVEAYTRATGQPWWTSARTTGARVDLLPLGVLTKRGLVEATLEHECVHVLTESTLADCPWWVREGLAGVLAGEFANLTQEGRSALARTVLSAKQGSRVERAVAQDASAGAGLPDSRCPTDADLHGAASPDAWRRAYAAAAACVSRALASGQRWQYLR